MTPRLRCEPQLDYLALRRGSHRGARRQYSSYPAPNFRLSAGSSHKQIQRIRQPTPRAPTVERCPTRPARPSRRSNTWDSGGGRALHNQFLRGDRKAAASTVSPGSKNPEGENQGPGTFEEEYTLFTVEVTKAIGEEHINAPCICVDVRADIHGQRYQDFSERSFHFEERCPGDSFAGKLHIAHHPQQRRSFREKTRGGSKNRRRCRSFKHGTPHEVGDEILSRGQSHALFERQQHFEAAKFFGFGDRIHPFKMKNCLPAMILAQPAGFQRHAARLILAVGRSGKNFPQSWEALRKISEDFSSDFALIAARPKDAGHQDPAWSFAAQW